MGKTRDNRRHTRNKKTHPRQTHNRIRKQKPKAAGRQRHRQSRGSTPSPTTKKSNIKHSNPSKQYSKNVYHKQNTEN